MKSFSAKDISKIVNGKITQGSDETLVKTAAYYVEHVNSENILLFLRVVDNVNSEAIAQYIPCVIVTDKKLESLKSIKECTIIKVDNIELAFWAFVYYYRNLFNIPVIAVTGTCGKSTTKEMILQILKPNWKVEGTDLSANSRTYNLRYLTRIDDTTEATVFETAVGKPRDITNSCKYFRPTIGIITNIDIDHMKGCKTMENYIKAKGEMLAGVGDKGTLIINVDDENINKLPIHTFKGNLITFGIKNPCNFKASDIEFVENGMSFSLNVDSMTHKIFVPGYGEHQVYNALAALAAVYQLGVKIEEATVNLKKFKNLLYHNQVQNGINGSIIIDDTWNTNPASLRAGIQVLNGISKGKKRIAVIADIGSLESLELEAHIDAGNMIMENGGVDILITIGPLTQEMGNQALKAGFKGEFYSFSSIEGIYELLQNKLDSNSIIFFKCRGYHDKPILDLVRKLKI